MARAGCAAHKRTMTEQTQTAAPAAPVRSGDTLEGVLWALAAYLFWGVLCARTLPFTTQFL